MCQIPDNSIAMADLQDIGAFMAVATHGGFRGAARITGTSASQLSEAVRRLAYNMKRMMNILGVALLLKAVSA